MNHEDHHCSGVSNSAFVTMVGHIQAKNWPEITHFRLISDFCWAYFINKSQTVDFQTKAIFSTQLNNFEATAAVGRNGETIKMNQWFAPQNLHKCSLELKKKKFQNVVRRFFFLCCRAIAARNVATRKLRRREKREKSAYFLWLTLRFNSVQGFEVSLHISQSRLQQWIPIHNFSRWHCMWQRLKLYLWLNRLRLAERWLTSNLNFAIARVKQWKKAKISAIAHSRSVPLSAVHNTFPTYPKKTSLDTA